jgi:hypothetical protein
LVSPTDETSSFSLSIQKNNNNKRNQQGIGSGGGDVTEPMEISDMEFQKLSQQVSLWI